MTSEYRGLLFPTLCAALTAWLVVAFTLPVQAEAPKQRTLWDLAGGSLTVGEVAYEKGDYVKAAHYFRIAAEKNDVWSTVAQYNLGVMYDKGQGVPQDYVQAHMWFNLAASRLPPGTDRATAVKNRDILAEKMTPAQIAEAQRLAREWKPKKEGK